ncbi:MAG: bifunctional (p)ppGpp synthetase/guanosine-3',5'-bis(diphosphate) 3'-pyrophosphohydrolase [Proteobacteria bacterium]|nr:bifunctional (p)ppGpp synthetase/guanosine-3',5'-bis(diphosphate) 3'-pyrophosphohydrolase [Pseudomonadota bacterium]MCP4920670.1 bifunctional (p)ppGpp synthetase/guanosine-3',5'-bis(diphosphate) 3'-pyrophosphohydrolase [Pseudomonadota bacterium]
MLRLNDLLDDISAYAPDADIDVVMRAYFYAAQAHKDQSRKSGEAYFTHPLAVAGILVEQKMDVDTVATALLHDVLEDCFVSKEQITETFSQTIAELVDGVTKISKLKFRSKEEAAAENFRKMMVAMSEDVRVILVKLADRLHNMRTLGSMPDHKKRRISQETLDIYAPLAARLGLTPWKVELEDHCLEHLHPEIHAELVQQMEETREQREAYIERVAAQIDRELERRGIKARSVAGRVKHNMSIYRKMQSQKVEFEQLHDLLAFRVLVDDLTGCYATLGFVHAIWQPVPDRIKDYIAMPKSNGYKSLHTTVIGPDGRRIEIQIRTQDMHDIAERGVAAHWKYKQGHLALSPAEMDQISRLRKVFDAAREVEDPDEFMEAVKLDLFHNEVFVFTPKGDVMEFPRGATALDFAYAVHSEVGNTCQGAKVNGRMVKLEYQLKSGDTIEVIRGKNQHPRRGWLEIAQTSRALGRIRKYLRQEERETGIRLGRDVLENELKKRGSSLAACVKQGSLKKLCKEHGFRDVESLFVHITQGHDPITGYVRELLPDFDWDAEANEREAGALEKILNRIRRRSSSPVLISGQEDILVDFAKCCNPLPGEPVAGFITRGRGISVHRRKCRQLLALDPQRRIPVAWDGNNENTQHTGGIRVLCVDRPGLLANITKTCTESGINISAANVQTLADDKAECDLEIAVTDVDELAKLIRRLEKIRGVISVDRLAR